MTCPDCYDVVTERRARNEGSQVTIDVAMLRELHYQYDPGFESTPIYCFSCMDNVMDLADAEWPCPTTELLDAYEERDRLRAALQRIAFEDELVYLGCADMPFCHDPHTNTKQCPVAVARAALEGRE